MEKNMSCKYSWGRILVSKLPNVYHPEMNYFNICIFSRHTYSGSPSWGPQPTCFQAGRRGPFSQFLFCLGNVPNANEGKVLSFLLSLGSPLGNRVIEIILKWCDQDEDLSCPKWRPILTKMITYHDQSVGLSWPNLCPLLTQLESYFEVYDNMFTILSHWNMWSEQNDDQLLLSWGFWVLKGEHEINYIQNCIYMFSKCSQHWHKKAFSSGVVCSAGVEVLLAPLIEVETSRIEHYLSRQITNRPQRSLEP